MGEEVRRDKFSPWERYMQTTILIYDNDYVVVWRAIDLSEGLVESVRSFN